MLTDSINRISLGFFPTPLHALPRLTEKLGGPRLFVKRDDQTGLATGGNKTRKLEFLVADALAHQADTLITAGAPQSNHARQTAAAAVLPGDNVNMHVKLIMPVALEAGSHFAIREGGLTVGSGVITKIVG